MGEYLFRGRVLTKSMSREDVGGHYLPWRQERTWVFDSAEVKMQILLNWKCADQYGKDTGEKEKSESSSRRFQGSNNWSRIPATRETETVANETVVPRNYPIDNILARPAKKWGGGGLTFNSKCPNLFSVSWPTYKNMFPYYPGKNRENWQNRIARPYGDSGASFIVPDSAQKMAEEYKVKSTRRVPCSGCLKTIENGGVDMTGRKDAKTVLWSSGRCEEWLLWEVLC